MPKKWTENTSEICKINMDILLVKGILTNFLFSMQASFLFQVT